MSTVKLISCSSATSPTLGTTAGVQPGVAYPQYPAAQPGYGHPQYPAQPAQAQGPPAYRDATGQNVAPGYDGGKENPGYNYSRFN